MDAIGRPSSTDRAVALETARENVAILEAASVRSLIDLPVNIYLQISLTNPPIP